MSATIRDKIKYFCQQKGMTEEQLADEINKAFEQPSGEELIHVLNKGAAIGRREMLDKACEWLKDYVADYLDRDEQYQLPIIDVVELITDFRKEMEEQQ